MGDAGDSSGDGEPAASDDPGSAAPDERTEMSGTGTETTSAGTETTGTGTETPSRTEAPPDRFFTRRGRAKSAALWGTVGFFAFLVLAQGYLLLGGALPVRYAALFAIALVVGVASGGIAYLTEHRLAAKGRV